MHEFEIEQLMIHTGGRRENDIATAWVSVGPVRLEAVMRTLDGSVIVGGAAIRDQQLLVDIGIAMRKQVLARIVELFAAEDRRGT